MMNPTKGAVLGAALLTFAPLLLVGSSAEAAECWRDEVKDAYETGVDHGRADGGTGERWDADRHSKGVELTDAQQACYGEGYSIGYQNAAADREKAGKAAAGGEGIPAEGSNERAYYDDGCRAGTEDAQAHMSMAYERHADDFDRQFEPYYARGYEHCWKQHR